MLGAASTGFATAFALILAIGAQNAFVLRQGLLRQHVFWVCLVCSISDAALICAGVIGFGAVTNRYPSLPNLMALAGAIFLLIYGALRVRAAWRGDYELELSGESANLLTTLMMLSVFTWLNPHFYLDTLGLIGAVSTQFEPSVLKIAFAGGAVTSSFVFFFSLGYGARFLAPVMQSAKAWRILDIIIGLVMWLLAFGLLAGAV